MPDASRYPQQLPEREFIGYGLTKPDPKWPGGAKIAVNFAINYWIGSELNPLLGDELHEILHLDLPPAAAGPIRNDMNESQYEYGGREGMPRLLSLIKKHDLPVTWNISVKALEIAPYWVQPIKDSKGEIACASYRYLDYLSVNPELEEEHVNTAIDSLQKLFEDKTLPRGWCVDRRSCDSQLLYTRAHDERKLPFLYSADSASDDLPFWLPSPLVGQEDKGLLVVPYQNDTSDAKFNVKGTGFPTPKHFHDYLVDTFDVLYAEGLEGEPRMMTIVLHPHIVGHPSRLAYLDKFIKYIKSKPDVWIATREQIAEHWASTFPYNPKTAFGQTKQVSCWHAEA